VLTKPVKLGPMALGLRAITGGLSRDDQVIIGGLANPFVRPGALVKPSPGEIKPIEEAPVPQAVQVRAIEPKGGDVQVGSDGTPAKRPAGN
jgi:hypothetical protein